MTLTFNGPALDGRLSLLVGEDGNLVDSGLGISRLRSAEVGGIFKCAADQDSGCRLEAETSAGIATSAPSEHLSLEDNTTALTGKLGVKGQGTTLSLQLTSRKGKRARYQLGISIKIGPPGTARCSSSGRE